MQRFCAGGAGGIDIGYKFNVLGWPLTLLGVTNPAGRYALTSLILTSSATTEHIEQAFVGYRNSTQSACRVSAGKDTICLM